MPVERVMRLDDRRLAEYRNIRDRELLRRRGLFMAEGRMVVDRLLDLAGHGYRVQSLLLNNASFLALQHRLLQPRQKLALLVGAEGPGLTAAAEAFADVCVRIPMQPEVDSLNLATATGIALYYLTV